MDEVVEKADDGVVYVGVVRVGVLEGECPWGEEGAGDGPVGFERGKGGFGGGEGMGGYLAGAVVMSVLVSTLASSSGIRGAVGLMLVVVSVLLGGTGAVSNRPRTMRKVSHTGETHDCIHSPCFECFEFASVWASCRNRKPSERRSSIPRRTGSDARVCPCSKRAVMARWAVYRPAQLPEGSCRSRSHCVHTEREWWRRRVSRHHTTRHRNRSASWKRRVTSRFWRRSCSIGTR